jgi:hypothetical protein
MTFIENLELFLSREGDFSEPEFPFLAFLVNLFTESTT